MNAPDRVVDWTGANQHLLVAEFARLKQRLAGDDETLAQLECDAARAAMPQRAAIDHLVDSFALTGFERDLMLLVAGVEMDARLAALCGEAQSQPQRPWATFGLALAALPDAHWSALSPARPLRQWRLVALDPAHGLTGSRLRADERVLHFLAGLDYLDERIQPLVRTVMPPAAMAPAHAALCDVIVARVACAGALMPVVQLNGSDASGREDIAAECAARLGLRLCTMAALAIPAGPDDLAAFVSLWEREAALGGLALMVDCGDDAPTAQALALVEQLQGFVLLAAHGAVTLRRAAVPVDVQHPSRAEQRQLWQQALGASASVAAHELDAVAAQFRLSARCIAQTAAGLVAENLGVDGHALWRACRRVAPARLTDLAQRIEASAGWDELVLPEAQMKVLAQIAVHLRHRLAVYDDWGFAGKGRRGMGINALFAGESGTGKTMAAEVLAKELHLDLFRIDLSAVVSKYIGETEKNLRRVFDAAEDTGAVLLFDEADALFGKRSEVKDSHDRYANIEVSYLLQRMEAYSGLAILTTNLKPALDPAFQRRLRFIVHFPFPDTAQREALWRRAFPARTPLAPAIDFARLARLHLTGGSVRNIALGAAFFAADAGEPVSMVHLLAAAQAEGAKLERPLTATEMRGWQ